MHKAKHAARRLRSAPLALGAACALTLAWLALRGPQPAKAIRLLMTLGRWASWPAAGARPARIVAVVTFVARRHPLEPRCLERSLAACVLLGGRATDVHIAVGVRRTEDGLSAHAWIPALSDGGDDGHVPLGRLTADGWSPGAS